MADREARFRTSNSSGEGRRRRRSTRGFGPAFAVLLGALALAISAPAARAVRPMQNRIAGPIRSTQMRPLPGSVHSKIALSADQGEMNGSTIIHGMSLVFRRSAEQEADLKQLIAAQQTAGSPLYHQWLKPGQFAAHYGMSAADLAKVASWLRSQGFSIDAIPASADRVDFSGTAAQVEAAFQTQMHRYRIHGQSRWANATDVELPQAIAGMTLNVEHLNTFRPAAQVVNRPVRAVPNRAGVAFKPNYTVQDGQGDEVNFVAPADIATIYDVNGLFSGGITGKGQSIAIAGQTDILTYKSDIAHFRSLSGLNAGNLPKQILITNPNTGPAVVSPPDLAEANIDVEWSGAVAPDANIIFVTVGSNQNYNVFDSVQYAIENPLVDGNTKFVPVISLSYGGCEQEVGSIGFIQQFESILEQANAQGQTVVASSGDDGSANCDDSDTRTNPPTAAHHGLSVNYPSSSQFVTAVGGTSFSGDLSGQSTYWSRNNGSANGSALSYIPEATWNDTPNTSGLNNSGGLSSSGGGASALFSKPSWQAGVSTADGKRDVPDISLAADPNHDGYVLCTEETNSAGTGLTGTSTCAYPVGANEAPYFPASGNGYIFGGTSIAAPQMAAMVALMNQKSGNTNGVGNINPILYVTAQNNPGAFHDITAGTNAVVCKKGSPNCVADGSGGYVMSCCNAHSGYDMVTGLGSVDVAALAAVWPTTSVSSATPALPPATFSMVAKSPSVSVTPGGSVTDVLVLSPSGVGPDSAAGFSGKVTLACSKLPVGITCGFSPGTSVNLSPGASQKVTLTLTSASSASLAGQSIPHRWPMAPALAGVFGLAMLGFGKRKFPSRWASRWMAVLILMAGLLTLTACGSGAPNAPGGNGGGTPTGGGGTPSTSTVTVTGTASNISVTDTIQLTIS